MANKYYKAYKFVVGGKSRPGIVGVKPKSGGVVDEFKSRKLKQLGRTQRKLKSQDKEMGEAIKSAQKKGLSRKDTVKGRKFATVSDARKTIAKVMKINKPYARKVQILTVLEQRAKVMGKMEQARLAKQAKLTLKKKHGKDK